jgi:hypothetical protein
LSGCKERRRTTQCPHSGFQCSLRIGAAPNFEVTLSLYSLTATHVLDGLIVVCGNGGFGLTSQGHASAPNKKLQSHLAKHVPRVIMEQSYLSPTNDVRVVMVVK